MALYNHDKTHMTANTKLISHRLLVSLSCARNTPWLLDCSNIFERYCLVVIHALQMKAVVLARCVKTMPSSINIADKSMSKRTIIIATHHHHVTNHQYRATRILVDVD